MDKKEMNRKRARSRYQNLSEEDKKSYKENASKNFKIWVDENPIQYRLNLAKDRAKRKKLPINIDLDYLTNLFEEQNGLCKYTGIKLSQDTNNKLTCMSLDRIDSTKGYVKGNVVFVSHIVNSMKNDLPEDDFLNVISLITEYYIKS